MSDSRLIAYIDEAGCSGDKYKNGSSEFLAIGAIVLAREHLDETPALFKSARDERGREKPFVKFSKSSDSDNFVLTQHLAKQKARIVQVALHKPSMEGNFTRSNHQSEYQYLCKFIIERLSWIARDTAQKSGDASTKVSLVFSEQKMYGYDDLKIYLEKIRRGRDRYNCSVEWDHIDDDIQVLPHINEHHIHLADIVASSIHKAIEPKRHGMTDDRFQRNLAPVVYRRKGTQYGVKLFPRNEIEQMREAGDFEFMRLL